jgi:CRISPR-associated protein (TIGR02710 family)
MDALPMMKARLRRIFRGEEQYGQGNAAEQARRFRLNELLPLTVERAKLNSARVPRDPVDLLVSLSGFSPETTILAFELLDRPQRLMIIGSEATRSSVDVIQETLKLPLSRLHVEECEPTDPLGIYQFVQKAARMVPRAGGQPRIIIDITGGKKVMSASAALAAAQLDLPLCYVDGRFDPELRQSEPGTERLVILDNPTRLFGDRDLDAALVAFRHGAYAAAHARFAKVAESAYEPARARFLRDLSEVYQAWCDLAFDGLGDQVRTMRDRLDEPWYRVPAAVRHRIEEQLDFLDTLAAEAEAEAAKRAKRAKTDSPPMTLNFYLLGEHYRKLGRHDFAALLYYRTIESAFALRLARIAPGFDCGKPDYALLTRDCDGGAGDGGTGDPAALAARYQAVATAVHGEAPAALPFRIGLMDAALLLYVLKDPILKLLDVNKEKALSHLSGQIHSRNQSVLAHGTGTVTPDLSEKLGNLAMRAVRALWALEFGAERVDERIATLQFVVEI